MEFGIFDHVDRNGLPLAEFYESRLKIVEAYDRGGFRSYHIAEHHATPVGMAPSPSVFLAGVAQRTTRLRFGPLVYLLPLYHPLRLVEEICMLDQMSGGRLELGIGRGVSPFEVGYYGVDPADRAAMHEEALAVMRAGLTQKFVSFEGRFYNFRDVPMELEPYQKPMPPMWVGVERPDSAERAARAGCNTLTAHPVAEAKAILTSAYRTAFAESAGQGSPCRASGSRASSWWPRRMRRRWRSRAEPIPKWQASLTHLPRPASIMRRPRIRGRWILTRSATAGAASRDRRRRSHAN